MDIKNKMEQPCTIADLKKEGIFDVCVQGVQNENQEIRNFRIRHIQRLPTDMDNHDQQDAENVNTSQDDTDAINTVSESEASNSEVERPSRTSYCSSMDQASSSQQHYYIFLYLSTSMIKKNNKKLKNNKFTYFQFFFAGMCSPLTAGINNDLQEDGFRMTLAELSPKM
ncbi:hypothetical protein NQ318_017118 [Aromia moschata]|uniref:Uncharacterized protein n=1 Tax=Aromia moschata TaxID=1265417 RepID=A0AAV8XG09_9CUCU|nr:hypothetical protein NQ318_017118 [Aromia moschata]